MTVWTDTVGWTDATVVDAADLNVYFRDNQNVLKTQIDSVGLPSLLIAQNAAGTGLWNVYTTPGVETTLWSFTLGANVLNTDGDRIRFHWTTGLAQNGNTKTLKLYVGSGVVTLLATAENVALNYGFAQVEVVRLSSSTAQCQAHIVHGAMLTGTSQYTYSAFVGAIDFTASQTVAVKGLSSAASNDVGIYRPVCWYWKGGGG
jgi:hypothetical protein